MSKSRRLLAAIGASALLALLVVGIALGAVSQAGRTADAVDSFKLNGQAYAQATITGTYSGNQTLQVRHLRNGVQIGGITNYPLANGAYYNSTVSTGRACVNTFQQATWVSQARLYLPSSAIISAWDSGPGRNLLC